MLADDVPALRETWCVGSTEGAGDSPTERGYSAIMRRHREQTEGMS
jgi:hypothetical protein